MEKLISEYLKTHEPKLCTLSTVNADGKPQSAVMAYAVEKDISIVLSTHDDSRKWKNLEKNPSVALVFGSDFTGYNIQYEGVAELITKDDDLEEMYYAANPALTQYRGQPHSGFIHVRPTWIRLSDYSVKPPKVEEKHYSQV